MSRFKHLITTAGVCLAVVLTAIPPAFSQQVNFAGGWRPLYHEDLPERIPGPNIGDYTGMPINEAARARGDAYDPDRISVVTEYICRQHGADYSMRGLANLRITREIDPVSQQAVAFHTRIGFHNMERTIWLDGRERPPEDAPHTFQGFSTGEFQGNMFKIHTTHLKQSYLRRNGLPASSERTFTEWWVLHGDYLTVVTSINDPVFMTEPMVRSQTWVRDPGQRMGFNDCQYTTEVPVGEDGDIVPHYMPGEHPFLDEFAERYRIPYSATRGGAETMFPEFRETMEEAPGDARFCTEECQ